ERRGALAVPPSAPPVVVAWRHGPSSRGERLPAHTPGPAHARPGGDPRRHPAPGAGAAARGGRRRRRDQRGVLRADRAGGPARRLGRGARRARPHAAAGRGGDRPSPRPRRGRGTAGPSAPPPGGSFLPGHSAAIPPRGLRAGVGAGPAHGRGRRQPRRPRLYAPVLEDPAARGNTARFVFFSPASRTFFPDWEDNATGIVATLRSYAGQSPRDRRL